jgi:hypothetical protein
MSLLLRYRYRQRIARQGMLHLVKHISCQQVSSTTANLRALAGIIAPSGAASITFCHELVESGITNPN